MADCFLHMYVLLKGKELSREEILELVKNYDVKLMDGVVASVMIFIPEQTDIDFAEFVADCSNPNVYNMVSELWTRQDTGYSTYRHNI